MEKVNEDDLGIFSIHMDITLEKLELTHKIQKKFILWVFLLLNLMTQVSHGCQ